MQRYIDIAISERNEKDMCSAFHYITVQKGREIKKKMPISQDDIDTIEPMFEKFKEYCLQRENMGTRVYAPQQGRIETNY